MSKQHPDFITYLKAAKSKIVHEKVPDLDAFFSNLNSFNPLLNHLDNVLYIIDFRNGEFKYIGPNSKYVQGYEAEEMMRYGPLRVIEELFHPVDAEIIVTQMFPEGNSVYLNTPGLDFAKSKISYSYRLKQKDGSYKMLLQQFTIMMVDEEKNPLMIMGTISNINDIHTKNELFCRVHTMNASNKWKKIFERIYPLNSETEIDLSPKEIEIIKFINKGLTTKEIAQLTNRSVETIKTQRKKILAKTGCQSMNEVIAMANRNGWV